MKRRQWTLADLSDARGAALTEFGLIAPVFCLMLVGVFDVSHTLYMQTDLQGALQKAARDATLQSNSSPEQQDILDGKVRKMVKLLNRNATVTFKRRFFRTFADAANPQPEDWSDTDQDGTCNHGEHYVDDNNNSTWDDDGGDAGQGGAKDKALYTVTVSYPRLLPLHKFLPSLSPTVKLVATTILANQPYADQGNYDPAAVQTRECS